MTLVRIILVLAVCVLAVGVCAGWLAWPFLSPFFEGAPLDVAVERLGAIADGTGGVPRAALWIGALLLVGGLIVVLSQRRGRHRISGRPAV